MIHYDSGLAYPVDGVLDYHPHLDQYEHNRLERENLTRRYVEHVPWDRTATPIASGVTEVLDLTTATIDGDTWDAVRQAFYPGVPGFYNMKAYLSFTLSPAAILAVGLSGVTLTYRVVDVWGGVGAWEEMGGCIATWTGAGAPTYFPAVTVSGSDTVGLVAGQGVQWGYVVTSAGNITYYESFKARAVCERVADIAGQWPCCSEE